MTTAARGLQLRLIQFYHQFRAEDLEFQQSIRRWLIEVPPLGKYAGLMILKVWATAPPHFQEPALSKMNGWTSAVHVSKTLRL